ncbi:MgtC/SapB family protein [Azospirillum sp. B4]|uniref:MgtC/SapB family protein n=1 Tax=Azospirillum sp. B4 TaxID=95605 RepID=UPI00034DE435|nr:MgtC/SapB family protein [Azospirillum sp. B4]
MDSTALLSRLAVSLAIGLLVGLERGWHSRSGQEYQRAVGLRTFALSGLLGGIAGALAGPQQPYILGTVFLGYAAAFAAFHWLEARGDTDTNPDRDLSVTSVVAGLVTFLLGALAVLGDVRAAIAAGVAMTGLLALRDPLHRWVATLSWPEVRAMLTLLAMSFLMLPILPDRPVDPWGALNPHSIWLLAVMIAAISFGGYVAVRALGDRLGVLMAAVAGGLASSTATTLTLARLGRAHPDSCRLLGAGILLAGAVMMTRVGVLAMVLNPDLLRPLAPALATAALGQVLGAAALIVRNRQHHVPHLNIANPLEVGMALKLAAFIAAIALAAQVLTQTLGAAGVLVLAALSGVADVDAVTLSMAHLGGKSLSLTVAAEGVLVVTAVNTVTKAVMAGWVGGLRLGAIVGGISALTLGAGALAMHW